MKKIGFLIACFLAFSVSAATLEERMDAVESVLCAEHGQLCPLPPPPADSDGDGVTDDVDQCPDTAVGVEVDAVGCEIIPLPVDTDGDGIPDETDECPSDPLNTCNDPAPVGPAPLATATTDKNLLDCVNEIGANGGWCEMRVPGDEPSIGAVYGPVPTRIEGTGFAGQEAILGAWGGAAYDKDSRVMYFTGGGHADYGGNDVYSFTFDEGQWSRLTDASQLDYQVYDWGTTLSYIWAPDVRAVPGSAHSYDSLEFLGNGKIFYSPRRVGNGDKVDAAEIDPAKFLTEGSDTQQYLFDTATNSWERIGAENFSYAKIAELPSGDLIIDTNSKVYRVTLNGSTLTSERIYTHADMGDGVMIYDAARDVLWIQYKKRLRAISPYTGETVIGSIDLTGHAYGKSVAVGDDGKVYVWDGCTKVTDYDPDTGALNTVDWGLAGPTHCQPTTKVYSKWVHLGGNVFAGITTDQSGMWIYSPGAPPLAAHPEPQTVATPDVELFHATFDNADWYADWQKSPNPGEHDKLDGTKHLDDASIMTADCVAGSCLRIDFTALECCGIAIHYAIPGEQENVIAEYWLKLADNFRPEIYDANGLQGSGGKLPGLGDVRAWPLDQCGNGGYNSDGIECWSMRLKFHDCGDETSCYGTNKTRIGGYVYSAENKSNHGDFAIFDGEGSNWLAAGFGTLGQLTPGQWYKVKIQVAMNTPDVHDGVIRAWINGELAYDKTDMLWRYVGHKDLHVRTFWMNAMFGGVDVGPAENTYIVIDELKIYGES